MLHQLRNDPAFVPELDFVMYLDEENPDGNDKAGRLLGQLF